MRSVRCTNFLLRGALLTGTACSSVNGNVYAEPTKLSPKEAAVKFRYAAAFLTKESQDVLMNLAPSLMSSSSADQIQAHHTTISWRPNGAILKGATASAGVAVRVHVLAVVEDEHCRVALVRVDGPSHVPQSSNTHPHITVACSKQRPYQAYYSNVLLERAECAKALIIQRDAGNRPVCATVPQGTTWEGTLTEHTVNKQIYGATMAKVTAFDESCGLDAIVCISDKWHDGNSSCDVDIIKFALEIADKLAGGLY